MQCLLVGIAEIQDCDNIYVVYELYKNVVLYARLLA
ncbi:hypothetical protein SAMN05421780_11811 [Flexibacter flexilis DSM 6793]|uniref:Uncharacterized protein n=1 Tax=Flexibacter flexilis DSM 6793 TaxID=927664 RepID=A0A1I1NR28_9BACT|nr:hypothetical protein SAMN05421780_11811 [Flexibacter flexilis DSM 6793]